MLPFTRDQFLDVFELYNRATWPFAVAFWLASAAVVVRLLLGRTGGRGTAALLALQWAWAGAIYHAIFFSRINPAARAFAALFLVQALLLAWYGVARGRLRFRIDGTAWSRAGAVLVGYALLYPLLAIAAGHGTLRSPWFGVPCPTALLTAGLLLAAEPPLRRTFIVPILWSLLAGSSALMLGMPPDFALLPAAALLGIRAVAPTREAHRARAGDMTTRATD